MKKHELQTALISLLAESADGRRLSMEALAAGYFIKLEKCRVSARIRASAKAALASAS